MFKDESIWTKMKTKSKEFEEQNKRIDIKKRILEDHGVDLDISYIEKPRDPSNDMNENDSMWDKLQPFEKALNDQQEYKNKIEASYDKAIMDILGPEYIPEFEDEKPKKRKKGLGGRLRRTSNK